MLMVRTRRQCKAQKMAEVVLLVWLKLAHGAGSF